jgi:hypothetical protein
MENSEGQKRKWVTKKADTSLDLKNAACFSMNIIKALRRLKGPFKFQALEASRIAQQVQNWIKINLTDSKATPYFLREIVPSYI